MTLKQCEDTHMGEEVERNWLEVMMQTYNYNHLVQMVREPPSQGAAARRFRMVLHGTVLDYVVFIGWP